MSKTRKRNVVPTALVSAMEYMASGEVLKRGKRFLKGKRKNPDITDAQMKSINNMLSGLTRAGYEIKVNYPNISIEDSEGRQWNTDVWNVKDKVKEIEVDEVLRERDKRKRKGTALVKGKKSNPSKIFTQLKDAQDLVKNLKSQGYSTKISRTPNDAYKVVWIMQDSGTRPKGNPSLEDAETLSKSWHGRDPKNVTEIEEIETFADHLAELADLEELGVLGQDGVSQFTISFKKDRPKLCAPNGKNLEFVSGDQRINVEDVGIERNGKKLVPLGYDYSIVYETDKHHLEDSNGYPESYEHFFAEEFYEENGILKDDFKLPNGDFDSEEWFQTCVQEGLVADAIEQGLLPMLIYNKTDEKLMLVGGVYSVEEVGIRN